MQSADSTTLADQSKGFTYFKSSVIFVILALFSAAINYAYYPAIAHFLTPGAFGATQALIAILLQVGAIFSGLNLVTIYLVHKLPSGQARHGIETLQKLTTWFFIIVALLITVFQSFALHFLHIDRPVYLLLVSLDLLTSVPFIIAFGYLQAEKRFVPAGLLQVSVVLIKLVAGVLMSKWFGAIGALLGFAVGQVVGMMVFWLVCKVLNKPAWSHRVLHSVHPPSRSQLLQLKPYAVSVAAIFLVSVLLALFISFDIIAARHYFDSALSGFYSGASTLSNAIVFAALPLIGVLLPHLDIRSLAHSKAALARTSLMVLLVIVVAMAAFKLLPGPLLKLFGHQYAVMSYLLWRLGILKALIAGLILSLQVSAFYVPLRSAIACIAGLLALIISVMNFHLTPSDFVAHLILVFVVLLGLGILNVVWLYNHGTKEKA